MKYLKTYENKHHVDKIKSWMIKHKLDLVDLNLRLDHKCTINTVVKEGVIFYVIYHFHGDLRKSAFLEWIGDGSEEVLQFLEEMAPEKIEEQRIKNESEKFNM